MTTLQHSPKRPIHASKNALANKWLTEQSEWEFSWRQLSDGLSCHPHPCSVCSRCSSIHFNFPPRMRIHWHFKGVGTSKEDFNPQPNQVFLLKAAFKLSIALVDNILHHGYDQRVREPTGTLDVIPNFLGISHPNYYHTKGPYVVSPFFPHFLGVPVSTTATVLKLFESCQKNALGSLANSSRPSRPGLQLMSRIRRKGCDYHRW
jgi:hypothetical protein